MSKLVFLVKDFKFLRTVCNALHNVLRMSVNLNDVTIFNILQDDYHSIINGISKSDAVNLLLNAQLAKKKGVKEKYI